MNHAARAGRRRTLLVFLTVALVGAACADASGRPSLGAPTTSATTAAGVTSDFGLAAEADTASVELVPLPGFGDGTLEVHTASGGRFEYPVLVAVTVDQRKQGLMGVLDLQGYVGMMFLFEDDVETSFWMKDTPLPLSIAYLTASGAVVSIADMEPCLNSDECPSYPAAGPFRMVLEVPRGNLSLLGVAADSVVNLVSG